MKGIRKIKSDIANGNKTIHIVGCHLLPRVIALDNIEISSRHIAQNILPRVKVFDHESVKKAIDSITSHIGQEVCFADSDICCGRGLSCSTHKQALSVLLQNVKFHEHISHAIHVAFFRCVEPFYSSWPCTSTGWTREFPTLMVEKMSSLASVRFSWLGTMTTTNYKDLPPRKT
ncbi:uncharacterized protein [Triticum aestivum]|uniref:uncharacterized protein isoform X2 n=1 Tax=Triticum aestivum TaxID=4565 RepID=UPI001D00EEF7|nr:uncharacterized protein LOC123074317 isoform X2 [Triticum aestivum]